MYRSIDDFISDYRMESENTLKIFKSIDLDKKSLKINENIRSMERIAWHIVQTLSEMMSKTGLIEQDVTEVNSIPGEFDEILRKYHELLERLLSEVKAKWRDDELTEKLEIYGESWAKGFLLRSMITHEIHHRGQLTVVMRYYGIRVPGIYGPSKEEWVNYKMPAME
jgi:uncharacterized damage-inducible protein DinB